MKFWINLCFILSLFLFTGCFEIIEEVNLNPNGSGNLTLTVNANQSKDQLDKVLAKDSIYGVKVPTRGDIDKSINEVLMKLRSVKGISNVTINRDFNTYILVIKCNFANVSSLNVAVNNIWLLFDKKASMNRAYFSFDKNTFKRIFDFNLIKDVKNKLGAQERDILSKASYTMVYRFQSEIASHTNTAATTSKSKKAIILKNNLLDIITGKKSIENEIKLK